MLRLRANTNCSHPFSLAVETLDGSLDNSFESLPFLWTLDNEMYRKSSIDNADFNFWIERTTAAHPPGPKTDQPYDLTFTVRR